jgi:hypothetical protein
LRKLLELSVQLLGQEGCEQFLREVLPKASGNPHYCLLEWMISQEWAERIAEPLAGYLGYSGAKQIAKSFSIAEIGSPVDILTKVCVAIGMPRMPVFPGPQSELEYTATKSSSVLANEDTNVESLKNQAIACAVSLESILKHIVWLYATIFDHWFLRRVREKLGDGDLRRVVDESDLGHLASCIGSLRKHGSAGGQHEAQVTQTLGKSLDLRNLEHKIERIRNGRRFAAHQKSEVDELEQLSALRDVLKAYVEIWEEGELAAILPYTVMVQAKRQNAWGEHAEVLDEFGRSFMVFLVDLGESPIGKKFFILPRSNPYPVAPLMVADPRCKHSSQTRGA